ncbi:MAG: hypothetical protein GX320_08105 [Tissierellia bacterium]|nr:hypothetical protein [Tissierellia bacterium]
MKKILFLFIITILLVAVLGCTSNNQDKTLVAEDVEEEPIDYKIEKIVLSKGFQSLAPNVEVLKKGTRLKLLASPGLLESSGVTIDKITKSGKEINIYVQSLANEEKKQLSTPQILLEINDPIIKKLEEVHFNIISQNYEPISLKLDKNQILNKVYSDFNIEPTSIPSVELTKLKDSFIWNISFDNVFNDEDSKFSLVNLDVAVDANTGEIIESTKDDISTYIDEGVLLDYIPHKALLYKRQHIEKEDEYDSLWIYNIETGDRSNLYTSRYKIHSALFNPDSEHISFIETDESKSDIYVASISDKIAYKITPVNKLQPKLMRWVDNNKLYFMDIDNSGTTLFEYNVDENKSTRKFYLDKTVENFDINDDNILFVEYDKALVNKNIYLTKDGSNLENIGTGFQATFLNNNNIVYLKNIEKEDKNILHIYNADRETEYKDLEHSITNYFKLDDNNIILTKKNSCNNDYILARYNLPEKSATSIANINSDKIFYDSEKAKAYVNLAPPPDKDKHNIIYSIDLNKLNIIDE